MSTELTARTPAGRQLVVLAEQHAADFGTRAGEHDRDNSFVAENITAMRSSGLLAACAPVEHAGLGVRSLHDVMVAVSRLARGCASTAICANMHMAAVWRHARDWEHAGATGDESTRKRLDVLLGVLGESDMIVAGAATEPGGAWNMPTTEATPTDTGYVINGRKTFATNSEVADSITVTVRVPGPDGRYHRGEAVVVAGTPGMTVLGDWDGLGMRGSGSHGIVFDGCRVPADRLTVGEPIGPPRAGDLLAAGVVNFPLVGAYLGIAEAAYACAVAHATAVRGTSREPAATRYPVQHLVAEIEVELAGARGALHRSGCAMDDAVAATDPPAEAGPLWPAIADWQCTKLLVNRAVTGIVDRAMTICGGSSFHSRHPLARMYRDARAGGFMQPFGPLDAYTFIGRVALDLDPFPDERHRAR
jgi:alkylation response protein AidB-like acyl-CoA dehydrogenase